MWRRRKSWSSLRVATVGGQQWPQHDEDPQEVQWHHPPHQERYLRHRGHVEVHRQEQDQGPGAGHSQSTNQDRGQWPASAIGGWPAAADCPCGPGSGGRAGGQILFRSSSTEADLGVGQPQSWGGPVQRSLHGLQGGTRQQERLLREQVVNTRCGKARWENLPSPYWQWKWHPPICHQTFCQGSRLHGHSPRHLH